MNILQALLIEHLVRYVLKERPHIIERAAYIICKEYITNIKEMENVLNKVESNILDKVDEFDFYVDSMMEHIYAI